MDTVRFEIAPCPHSDVARLQAELSIDAVLAQVLVRRGLSDPQTARQFLAGGERHDPDAFAGMGDITSCILRHVERETKITVHGDYDVDGVCSTGVLVRVLRELGADVDWYLPDRSGDGYGLSAHTIERLAERGTKLLITVDCAITAVAEVELAKSLGIEVIVTDHHTPLADGTLPDTHILHPAVCGYPCVDLCATGVAHKLAEALAQATGRELACVAEDLDLVALATIADVVALVGENRRLVREGLLALKSTAKPGLRSLMAVAGVDPSRLDERAVGYALAPRLNAAGRLYRADAALELILTEDADRAVEIADELHRANSERRHAETRILFQAEAQIAEAGEQPAYVLFGDDWHAGVIGVVASRLAERHQRPVIVIALDGESGKGSGRSIEAFDLLAALHACAGHLVRYGGHRGAAGLEIEREQLEPFVAALCAHAKDIAVDEEIQASVRVDAVLCADELNLELAEALQALAPFGRSNPKVSLLLAAARFREPRAMGKGKHVRFTVTSAGSRLPAVAFGMGADLPVAEGTLADGIFALEVNEWNGVSEPRLNLLHAQPCAPEPIDLLGERRPYLQRVWDDLRSEPADGRSASECAPARNVHDHRGRGIAGTIVGLVASGEPVLVVCADARLRMAQMSMTIGGFSLCSYETLEREPSLSAEHTHLVALDPPSHKRFEDLTRGGTAEQHTHLLWGESEIEFARRILERDHDLRGGLASLYRALRSAGSSEGEDLQSILSEVRPPDTPLTTGRPAGLACVLLRVLDELGLIEIDTRTETVTMSSCERTSLERSPTYRAHTKRLTEGRALLGEVRRAAA